MGNDGNDRNGEDDEMICALTEDEYAVLRRGLDALPQTLPPRAVWHRIREQAEAEGLLSTAQPPRRQWWWPAGVGVAAAAVLAVVMMPGTPDGGGSITTVPRPVADSGMPTSNLTALRAESRQLERDLRALPSEPKVAQAGTVATISEIEDRIAAIDYLLNDGAETMSVDEREIYWSERVRLMKLLLQLRYAQAQRAAY